MPPLSDANASYESELHQAALTAYREVAERPEDAPETPPAAQTSEAPAGQPAAATTTTTTEEQPKTPAEGRDELGRFAARRKAEDDAAAAAQPGATDPAAAEGAAKAEAEAAAAAAAAIAPPPSWGVKAKAAWDTVPPAVREEIAKREAEMGQGLAALRDYKDLKPYAEMATQAGTTIPKALDHYIGIDNLMKRDMAGGLAFCAESYGMPHAQIGQMFASLAQRYGVNVTPAAAAPAANANGQAALDDDDPLMAVLQPVLAPILAQITEMKTAHAKEINELKSHHSARVETDRNASVQSLADEITRFAADPKNIYFANVEPAIAKLFEGRMVPLTGNHRADLQAAYDLAVRMDPEIHQTLIEKQLASERDAQRQRDQDAADKARNASKSLGGSRVPGTTTRAPAPSDSGDEIEATVRAAYRAHSQA